MSDSIDEQTCAAIVQEIDIKDLRELLQNQKRHLTPRYFANGFILNKIPPQALRDGFRNAILREEAIRHAIYAAWHRKQRPLVSAVQSAACAWLPIDDAVRWLTDRFAPSEAELKWIRTAPRSTGSVSREWIDAVLERSNFGSDRRLFSTAAARTSDPIKAALTGLKESALELIGFDLQSVSSESRAITQAVREGDFASSIGILNQNPRAQHLHALLCFAQGDLIGAKAAAARIPTDNMVDRARAAAFHALFALSLGQVDAAIDATNPSKIVLEWPTWSILRGLAFYRGGQTIRAAKEILEEKEDADRRGGNITLELAVALLGKAQLQPPTNALSFLSRGWSRVSERREIGRLIGAISAPVDLGRRPTNPPNFTPGDLSVARSRATEDLPKLSSWERALEACAAIIDELQKASRTANLDLVTTLSKDAAEQLKAFEQLDSEARTWLGPHSKALSPFDRSHISETQWRATYREMFRGASTRKLSEDAARLAAEHARIRKELEGLGIEVPGELEQADTIEKLAGVEKVLAPIIERQRAHRDALQGEFRRLRALPGHARAECYRRLLKEMGPQRISTVVEEAAIDPEAHDAEMLWAGLGRVLESRAEIPGKLWPALARLQPHSIVEHLIELHLLEPLTTHEISKLAVQTLVEALGHELSQLPLEFRRRLQIYRATHASDTEQLRALADLVAEEPHDNVVASAFLESLLRHGHSESACCVAILLTKAEYQFPASIEQGIQYAFLDFLLQATIDPARKNALAGKIFAELGSIPRDPEAMIVALLIALLEGNSDAYLRLQFGPTKEFDRAQAVYTKLVDNLERRLNALSKPHAVATDTDAQIRARNLIKNVEREIERRTWYAAWVYAEDYHQHVRPKLRQWLDGVCRTGTFSRVDVSELLAETGKTHRIPRLNSSKTVNAARGYFDRFFGNLEELQKLRRDLGATGDLRKLLATGDEGNIESELQRFENKAMEYPTLKRAATELRRALA